MNQKPSIATMRDLIPQASEVHLSNGMILKLRKVTLRDHAWMRDVYGGTEKVEELFSSLHIEPMVRLFFHLLEEESKQKFPPKEVTQTDEDGVTTTITLGGYKRLASEIDASGSDLLAIANGLNLAFGVSNPVSEGTEKENSGSSAKKKRNAQKLIGD